MKHKELVAEYVENRDAREEAAMMIRFGVEKRAVKKREARKRAESGPARPKGPRRNSNERLLLGSDSDDDRMQTRKVVSGDSLDGYVDRGHGTAKGFHPDDDGDSELLQLPMHDSSNDQSTMGEFNGLDEAAARIKNPIPEPEKPPPPPTQDDAFAEVCARVTPKASALYSPYRFPMRYFILIDNLHRLVLVLVTVVLSPLFGVGVFLNLVAHVSMFVALLATSPYHDKWEQLLSLIATGCDVFNGVYVVLIWAWPNEPALTNDATVIIVMIITIAIPLVACIGLFGIGMYTAWSNPYRKAEREKLKKEEEARRKIKMQRRKQEELEKKFRKEMGGKALSPEQSMSHRASVGEVIPPDPDEVKTNVIDRETKGTMLRFFLIGAVPWLIASAVVCIMAITKDDATNDDFVLGSDSSLRTQEYVLGGRFDWEDFTEHCCCFESRTPISGFNLTERWVCSNVAKNTTGFNYTHVIEQLRLSNGNPSALYVSGVAPTTTVSKNRRGILSTGIFLSGLAQDDGVPIRSVCGNILRSPSQCSIELQDSNSTDSQTGRGTVVLQCQPSDYLSTAWNVTDTAQRLLW
eukprot:GILI01012322.1.p1 GENE.GILI01012322.1~~GILI01012322.1.p1  ORF type:complete len:597 (+),score=96.52 GILI01012322.1:56-1792(+)